MFTKPKQANVINEFPDDKPLPHALNANSPRQRESTSISRRRFLGAGAAATAMSAAMAQAAPCESSLVVDCQSHIFLPDVLELMRRRRVEPLIYEQDGTVFLQMGDWLRKIPKHYSSVEAKLAAMDANGIDITMLSTNDPGPEWFGEDGPAVSQVIHDSLASVIAQHPTRFRGLCVLPLQNARAAYDELDRCINTLGFKGILLYTNIAGAWCDEPQFHWLYARAVELGVPILLHPAKPMTTEQVKGYELTSTLGNMFENTVALSRIIASGLLDRHPTLKLVCPHLGGTLPYIAGRMDHQLSVLKRGPQNLQRKPSEYLRSIYMDIVSPLPEAMEFAVNFSGPDRLLYSSDHPWVDPSVTLGCFSEVPLTSVSRARVLGLNAKELFKL